MLIVQFANRADLLKAWSALTTVSTIIGAAPQVDTRDLADRIEQIRSATHAFAEARLLDALRAGTVELDDAGLAEAERLLGGDGPDAASRLGLTVDGQPVASDVLADAAVDALARWRRRAEHPLASRAAVVAATVVARSCEGLLADLAPGASVRVG